MNISSNYDYYRYMLYGNSTASISGQQLAESSSGKVLSTDNASGSEWSKKVQSPLSSLVEDGTITEEQEAAIGKALEQARLAHQTQAGAANASGDPLASLVESGTITEEQSDAVRSTLDRTRGPRMMAPPPPPPPASSGGEEEEEDTITDILDSLVENGTITEAQQAAVMSAFESAMKAYSAQAYSYDNYDSSDSSFSMSL